jgi:hypothetical protein
VKLVPLIVIEVDVHVPFWIRAGLTSAILGGGVPVIVKSPGAAPIFHCELS